MSDHSTPEKLLHYVLDDAHRLVKRSNVGEVSIEVYNRPTDLLVEQELRGRKDVDIRNIKLLRDQYDQNLYFILNISRNHQEVLQPGKYPDQFGDLVQIMSFEMNNYVNMTTSNRDTIPTADFILNRTFGLSRETSMLFVFDRSKTKNAEWVQFNLNEFGLGVGNQRFRFETKDLDEAPTLDFEELKQQD